MWKINLDKFKQTTSKFDKAVLKALLWEMSFQRILCELVIVDAIHTCRENGEAIPTSETIDNYNETLEAERILIRYLGRREAARVYGVMEGVTSDVKTVDYVLSKDANRFSVAENQPRIFQWNSEQKGKILRCDDPLNT